jgi:hypothetical protein
VAADRPIPERYEGKPRRFVLRAGTRLCRIHDCKLGPTRCNPHLAPRSGPGGGRFDGTGEDPYAFLYAAGDEGTAVAERLLRDAAWDERGARHLPRAAIRGRCVSWIEPARDLELVALRSGRDLAAVAQDEWLITTPASDYASTRRWGHALRRWAPWAGGFVWRSRPEPGGEAFVFFEDRVGDEPFRICADAPLAQGENRLDDGIGELLLRRILEEYRVVLAPSFGS